MYISFSTATGHCQPRLIRRILGDDREKNELNTIFLPQFCQMYLQIIKIFVFFNIGVMRNSDEL